MFESIMKMFKKEQKSGKIAGDRLRMVLVHDRANMSPETMSNLRDDIIQVISKYMEIDKRDMELSFENEANAVALVANIPIRRVKH